MPLKTIRLRSKLIRNSSNNNRVKFLAYSGDAVDLSDYGIDAPAVYDLESTSIASQTLPMNYNHRVKVGETDKVLNTKQTIRGTGEYTESNKITERIKNSDRDYEASIELDVRDAQITFHENGFTANGQKFEGPHYLIKNSILDAMAITEEGRDSMTKVHKLSKSELNRIKNSKKPTKKPTKAPARRVTATKRRPITNTLPRKKVAAPEPVTTIPYSKLRRLENKYPDYQELIFKGVDAGHSFARIHNTVKLAALEDGLPTPPKQGKESVDLLEARLLNAVVAEPERILEKAYGKEVRDRVMNMDQIGLKELLVLGANQLGGQFTGFSDIDQLINFMGAANQGRLHNAAGFSTFSMPNLFKRVTELVIEDAWKIENLFAPGMCFPTSHSDFKTHERYRPSGGSMWEGLDANGRIKAGSFGKEHRYTSNLDTKAQMLAFNREMVENDDLGVIQELLDLMVEGGEIIPDIKLVQHMLAADGNGFWATTDTTSLKKNSYSGTALTDANLNTVWLAAKKQTIAKGRVNWVNQISDKWDLVVPPELERTAEELVDPGRLISPVDTTNKRGDKPYWTGKVGVKTFNQLSNTSISTSITPSGTTWFLWPRGVKYSPFAISYLRGRKRPVVRVKEAPVDMLGFVVVGVFDVEINDREQSAIIRCQQ